MEEVIVDIERDGTVKVDAVGFSGKDCKDLTASLEEAVGEVTEVKQKPEWHRNRQVARSAGN